MATRIVNLKDFGNELEAETDREIANLRQATIDSVARAIPMLVKASPVDTGLYAQSWDFTVEEKDILLGNYAPYAGIIEYGARPFKPPIGPLLEWAKRVLTNQVDEKTGKKVHTGQPESGYSSAVWALAKYTQAKIEREGMQPRHIMDDAIPVIIENIKEEFKRLNNGW